MGKLFGFSIEDDDIQRPGSISPVPENNSDGVDYYASGGFGGAYVDIEGVYRTETMISLEESINDKKRLMHSIFQEI